MRTLAEFLNMNLHRLNLPEHVNFFTDFIALTERYGGAALHYEDADMARLRQLHAMEQDLVARSSAHIETAEMQELEQQRRVLSFEIAQEEMAQPTFTADHIRFWLHQLRELNPQKLEHRRRLINSFVNAVYLYDDYLVFVGNYKDSTKTITFAELEEIGLGSDAFASGVPKNKRGL